MDYLLWLKNEKWKNSKWFIKKMSHSLSVNIKNNTAVLFKV